MAKGISLKSLNYIAASLGLLLLVHSAQAVPRVEWRIDRNGILRPQDSNELLFLPNDDAIDAFVPVRFGGEANPIAIVKMSDIEVGADIAKNPTYRSLRNHIREWLQRLGAIDNTGHSMRKISVSFIFHQPPNWDKTYRSTDNIKVSGIWRYDGDSSAGVRTAAIKFFPLRPGLTKEFPENQISFSLAADQREGMRVQSLPNGFLLRQLPYDSQSDDWWRVSITRNDVSTGFSFAAIIMLSDGAITITVEIIPMRRSKDDRIEDGIKITLSEKFFQEMSQDIKILRGKSRKDYYSCLTPYRFNPYSLLGVSKKTTNAEIKKAYHKMALKYHPDKNLDNKEWATRKFQQIGAACEILRDSQRRAAYDGCDPEDF
ncbi:MAG: J domain-containing protein [Puniceicoccales bacterium]|jgi:hypothetical protein|nr:J domain-containing protein [Puniceicoccales bacterium]